MKEQFQAILENEEFDSKSKVEEIARIVGEQMVIKSKYNETLTKFKDKESELEKTTQELETIRNNSLTDSEKIANAAKAAQEMKIEYAKKINRLDAEKQFISAGLAEDDYKSLIDNLISEDAESTANRIAGISELLKKQKEQAINQTKEELLKDTPRPKDTNAPQPTKLSKEEFVKMSGWEKSELFKNDRELFDELTQK